MFRFDTLLLAWAIGAISPAAPAAPAWHGLGRAIGAAELSSWDIDVRPDGTGLPRGSGSVTDGQTVYDEQCASCHGTFGESNDYIALTGGIGSLASESPQRTVSSKLNYATTLWDYINRAMPFNNSKTLSADQVYAVTAYILSLDGIVPEVAVLDQNSLPQVVMPNRDGFTLEHGMGAKDGKPDIVNTACMTDCAPAEVKVISELPAGFAAQMYGDIQTHFRRFDRPPVEASAGGTPPAGLAAAQSSGCFACHDFDEPRVGPAFAAIGSRYAEDRAGTQTLRDKVRAGGSGVWGSVPMPAQASVSEGDLASIVAWILDGAPRQ